MNGVRLAVRASTFAQRGAFVVGRIAEGSLIMEMGGVLVPGSEVDDPSMFLQVATDGFLGPAGNPGDFINHSCDPNTWIEAVDGRGFLYALRAIEDGEELAYDYAATSTDMPERWHMRCACPAADCRRVISGARWLPVVRAQEYAARGMLPRYVLDTLRI